jgi:cephalosporin hydroxylase
MNFIHHLAQKTNHPLIQNLHLLLADPLRYIYRRIGPLRRDYHRRFAMTLRQWAQHHQHTIAFDQCHWMGIRAIKNPLDAWIYQEILYEIKPDIVIEIGSYYGGSTLYLAHLLDILNNGIVLSIDIDRTNFQASHDRIVCLTGDSASPAILEKVQALCQHKTILVIHDGDHSKEAVLRDMHAYADIVSINSYLIVEDGITDLYRPGGDFGNYNAGPLIAIEQFLQTHPNYIVDSERERYIMTYNPKGFLKRVR